MSFGVIASPEDLQCPNGCGRAMDRILNKDAYLCRRCGWGVSGLEIHVNIRRNLRQMIADKTIGRQFVTDKG